MSDLFDALSPEAHEELRKRSQPGWTAPVVATLTDEPFSDPDWIFLGLRSDKQPRDVRRERPEA